MSLFELRFRRAALPPSGEAAFKFFADRLYSGNVPHRPRYRKAKKADKTTILNELCQSASYNRKYAIGLLKHAGKTQTRRQTLKLPPNHAKNGPMESPGVPAALKQKLARKKRSLNLVSLQHSLDKALEYLDRLFVLRV